MAQSCPTARRLRARAAAFTLIELILVIGIIAILAGLGIGVAATAYIRMKRENTAVQIRAVEHVLENYRDTFGEYPDAVRSSTAPGNLGTLNAANSAAAALLIDAGILENVRHVGATPYVVDDYGKGATDWQDRRLRIVTGGFNRPGLDIWSLGPNGVSERTAQRRQYGDDIVNWSAE